MCKLFLVVAQRPSATLTVINLCSLQKNITVLSERLSQPHLAAKILNRGYLTNGKLSTFIYKVGKKVT